MGKKIKAAIYEWRVDRLIKSKSAQRYLAVAKSYGYELLRDECTPAKIVATNGTTSIIWA